MSAAVEKDAIARSGHAKALLWHDASVKRFEIDQRDGDAAAWRRRAGTLSARPDRPLGRARFVRLTDRVPHAGHRLDQAWLVRALAQLPPQPAHPDPQILEIVAV